MEEKTLKQSNNKQSTRQSTAVFGLGSAITEADSEITGSRLPTCNQVLRCLMFHIQHGATENTKQGGRQRKLCFQKSPYSIRKETFQ